MAGYWPSTFLWSQYPAIMTEQASSIYYMAKKRTFTCGNNTGFPKWVRWGHLANYSSQSECRVRFSLPTWGFSHIINTDIITVVEHFFFTMEVVFQDLSVQNLTCLTNHTAQQLVTDIKFNDPACFQRTFCTNITYQGHLLYEKKTKTNTQAIFPATRPHLCHT